jgi:endonuclease/exonuclease/phosphatase family metal-dependent hydrolase
MALIRVATYNIHKGVQGLGPLRRLEIHNLVHAVEQLDADIVCLQEVRKVHRKEAKFFAHWPDMPQADFLAPEGYEAVYRTNAITRHGDMSDHRFEQRGFLHSEVRIYERTVHVLVVHLGLIRSSRVRQVEQLQRYIDREIPKNDPLLLAGDFNDWGTTARSSLKQFGLSTFDHAQAATYPSRLPLVQLDYVYARGLRPVGLMVPRGRIWGRMSDHLPLIAEFDLSVEAA